MRKNYKNLSLFILSLSYFTSILTSCASYNPPEERGYHYTKTKFEDFKTIIRITDRREVIGYLEQESIVPKGFREERDNFYVYDKNFKRVGMITQNGETYRLLKDEQLFIGTYVLDEGIKAILNTSGNVVLEEYTIRARP